MFLETIVLACVAGYMYVRGYRVRKSATPLIGN